jgi:hypothetical protein
MVPQRNQRIGISLTTDPRNSLVPLIRPGQNKNLGFLVFGFESGNRFFLFAARGASARPMDGMQPYRASAVTPSLKAKRPSFFNSLLAWHRYSMTPKYWPTARPLSSSKRGCSEGVQQRNAEPLLLNRFPHGAIGPLAASGVINQRCDLLRCLSPFLHIASSGIELPVYWLRL